MMWQRIIYLFIMLLLGKHICFPSSPRYLELADSADYFISHQNWNRAEEKIVEALRLEPANFTNSLLLANLGLVQAHQGEFNKALQSLSLGLNIAPSSTVLLNNRAHVFLELDSIDSAIKDIDRSLEIDSIQAWPLQTRGFIYLQNKDIENASSIFYKLKKEFPENASVYAGLAAIDELEGKLEVAKTHYREALRLDPQDDITREAFIMALINTNDYTGARTEIREALKINPENPMFYLLRGYLHRLNFRLDEAQADKKLAISKGIDPKYASSFIP